MSANRNNLDDLLEVGLSSAFERLPEDAAGSASGSDPAPRVPLRDVPIPEKIGRYEVDSPIGQGGMGLILRVRDSDLGRDLAIKVIHADHAAIPEMVARFEEEARICGRLQHPGVVPVHEIGKADDGRPFFTMRLVKGDTFSDLLAERQGLENDQPRLLHVFLKICQTVAYAHTCGVVHRDLKPANVMVGSFGEVQVMDWGFALSSETTASCSPASRPRIVGTPAYMPPEQATGDTEGADARVDVFALGAILCEILTGRPPYHGETRAEVLLAAAKAWQEDIGERLRSSGADAALVELAELCMSPDPSDRPADAGDVAAKVAHHLSTVAERAHALELEAAKTRARAESERRSRRLRMTLAGTVVIAVLVVGATWFWIEVDRAARVARAEKVVAGALEEASKLHGEALQSPGNLALWSQAAFAAREAQSLAKKSDTSADTLAKASLLVADLELEQQQAVSNAKMIEKLLTIRPQIGDDRKCDVQEADYRSAFLEYGLDLERLTPEESAGRLQSSAILPHLVAALDDWISSRMTHEDHESVDRLMDVVSRVDPDPWRKALRSAMVARDLPRLKELAASPEVDEAPVQTLDLLGKALYRTEARKAAQEVYWKAHYRFPEDFWINNNLAFLLRGGPRKDQKQAASLFAMALATRPHSTHAIGNLASTLINNGDLERARQYLDRGLLIDPEWGYFDYYVGRILRRKGEHEKAVARLEKAIASGSDAAHANAHMAISLSHLKRYAEARAASREAIKLAPKCGLARRSLAYVLGEEGELEQAVAASREAIVADSELPSLWQELAWGLRQMGALEEAADALEQGLKIDAEHPEIRCDLGYVRTRLGQFKQAVELLEKGHALGMRSGPWSYPSKRWLEQAEALAERETDLQQAGDSEPPPLDPKDCAHLAHAAALKGRHLLAARLFKDALERSPELASKSPMPVLVDAAHAAARAAAGEGPGTEALNPVERTRWRRQALLWMRQDLDAVIAEKAAGQASSGELKRIVYRWTHTPALDPFRNESRLAELPESEQRDWRRFWADVQDLISASPPKNSEKSR